MTGLGECCLLANVYRTQVWAQFIDCLECEKPSMRKKREKVYILSVEKLRIRDSSVVI
jgi:hypothetical protein